MFKLDFVEGFNFANTTLKTQSIKKYLISYVGLSLKLP